MIYTRDKIEENLKTFLRRKEKESQEISRLIEQCPDGHKMDKLSSRLYGIEEVLIPIKDLISRLFPKDEILVDEIVPRSREVICDELL